MSSSAASEPHVSAVGAGGIHIDARPVGRDPGRVESLAARAAVPGMRGIEEAAKISVTSSSGKSSVGISLTEGEQNQIGVFFAALQDHFEGEKLVRVIPHLEVVLVRDGAGNEREIHPDDLTPEAREVYLELKSAFERKCPPQRWGAPAFAREGKANLNGQKPFRARVSGDKSAKSFINSRLPELTQGMTASEKRTIMRRIGLAEIAVTKHTAGLENLIKKNEEALENATGDGANELKKDLKKLHKQLEELKDLDPYALYWLAVFYPKNPQDAKECRERADAIKEAALAATGNEQYAAELGSILIKGREQYFYFCQANGIMMKNTLATEQALATAVQLEARFAAEAMKPPSEIEEEFYADVDQFDNADVRGDMRRLGMETYKQMYNFAAKSADASVNSPGNFAREVFDGAEVEQESCAEQLGARAPEEIAKFRRGAAIAHELIEKRARAYEAIIASSYQDRIVTQSEHEMIQAIDVRLGELEKIDSREFFDLLLLYDADPAKEEANVREAFKHQEAGTVELLMSRLSNPLVRSMIEEVLAVEQEMDISARAKANVNALVGEALERANADLADPLGVNEGVPSFGAEELRQRLIEVEEEVYSAAKGHLTGELPAIYKRTGHAASRALKSFPSEDDGWPAGFSHKAFNSQFASD